MQLDSKEKHDRYFHIDDDSFPFTAKSPAKKYYCESYSDLENMLTDNVAGLDTFKHVQTLTIRVGNKWKHISLESLANNPLIAYYMIAYSRATSDYVKGFLFDGVLNEQPNIYYGEGQAFDTIRNAISECEIENIRAAKRQAKQDGR
jgi:hypothetical protein